MSQFSSLRWTHSTAVDTAVVPVLKKAPSELLSWHDNAVLVANSLLEHAPIHVHTSTKLKHVDAILDGAGQRFALVLDASDRFVGIVAARDLFGRKSIKAAHDLGVAHGELNVEHLMQPLQQLPIITMGQLQRSRIGDVVATLQKSGRDFLLVQQEGQWVALVASLTIVERTGESVQIHHHASSFAEIMYAVQHADDLE